MLKTFSMFIICWLLAVSMNYAEVIKADYTVSYGIFGKIGTATAILKKEDKKYSIDIKLEATGLAKVLSGGRTEHHISTGHIHNGLMVSDLYQVIKSHGKVVINKEYWIDHKRKKITKKYTKYKKGKLITDKTSFLNFYAKDDLLTLYFNLDSAIKNKQKPQTYHFEAVGAERQKGKVTVIIPDKSTLQRYHKEIGNDSAWYATAIIHQKIFSSKEGRLMLGVAKDGITNKAMLKDVIFFGDIRAIRTK
jgi:hypothetical protein